MTPIQQLFLGVGAKDKTYLEDLFNTNLFHGVSSGSTAIANGIDNLAKGGMVWLKARTDDRDSAIFDTARMNTSTTSSHALRSNTDHQNIDYSSYPVTWTNTGLSIPGGDGDLNISGEDYTAWNFCKTPGFFDIVTYTGNSVGGDSNTRSIAHNLGSAPGMIIIKSIQSGKWSVYHRSKGNRWVGYLNLDEAGDDNRDNWNSFTATATHFGLGADGGLYVNNNGVDYVAYLFAGGESTAATARSVDFDGTGDALSIPDSSDFDLGSGNFTIECWAKVGTSNGSNQECFINQWVSGQYAFFFGSVSEYLHFYWSTTGSNTSNHNSGYKVTKDGQWHHYAVTRNGSDLRFFVDGLQRGGLFSMTDTINNSTNSVVIGNNPDVGDGSRHFNGKISNVRVVKGTAVYTSSFRPPTEPLTNITNTKLLCCNNSSTTGSTVTPGTITASGDPTASTESPFDDPSAFVFGENEDQNVIKTGSYVGNGSATGPEIVLGWEPSWVMVKRVSGGTGGWIIWDSMRGMTALGANDKALFADADDVEASADYLDITSTGFKLKVDYAFLNNSGDTFIYLAIRRSDGYVGKPIEDATKCFAMDTGNSSGSPVIPVFDSSFPVDFALRRQPGSTDDWDATARLFQGKRLKANTVDALGSHTSSIYDSNVGWSNGDFNSDYQSWMLKRYSGFDIVAYDGISAIRDVPHSLGKAAEMIWIKRTDGGSDEWTVGHKALDSGNWNKFLKLNTTDSEANAYGTFNSTAPSATHFTLATSSRANADNQKYVAMLFSSVDGISKVGYYTGSGGSQTITTGFQPRFLIIKSTSASGAWYTLDTTRGWGSGNDEYLEMNNDNAQDSLDFGAPTSTGFTISSVQNGNGTKYIYYAHA